MRRDLCIVVLLVVLVLPFMPGQAGAECGQVAAFADCGQIAVYFDTLGTERFQNPPGTLGQLDTVYVYGEHFTIPFISGAQYQIDYGPTLNFLLDFGTPPVTIGRSSDGISLAFSGADLKRGRKFLIHQALVSWAVDECGDRNSNYPQVGPHPLFPNPTPIVIAFPSTSTIPAFGARSQTCQYVEMDIQPGECPNLFDSTLWDTTSASDRKGGVIRVAVLGGATVDAGSIDPMSCRLQGVAPLTVLGVKDVSTPDDTTACVCNDLRDDGFDDLRLEFLARDVAAQLTPKSPGDTLRLVLTGTYNDGMPFTASDCVVVIPGGFSAASPPPVASTVELGFATPNPFNPVTRIAYAVAEGQRVRLSVFDVRGRLVETLVDEVKAPGAYGVDWDASRLASGVYFYRLQAAGYTVVRRAALIK